MGDEHLTDDAIDPDRATVARALAIGVPADRSDPRSASVATVGQTGAERVTLLGIFGLAFHLRPRLQMTQPHPRLWPIGFLPARCAGFLARAGFLAARGGFLAADFLAADFLAFLAFLGPCA